MRPGTAQCMDKYSHAPSSSLAQPATVMGGGGGLGSSLKHRKKVTAPKQPSLPPDHSAFFLCHSDYGKFFFFDWSEMQM